MDYIKEFNVEDGKFTEKEMEIRTAMADLWMVSPFISDKQKKCRIKKLFK